MTRRRRTMMGGGRRGGMPLALRLVLLLLALLGVMLRQVSRAQLDFCAMQDPSVCVGTAHIFSRLSGDEEGEAAAMLVDTDIGDYSSPAPCGEDLIVGSWFQGLVLFEHLGGGNYSQVSDSGYGDILTTFLEDNFLHPACVDVDDDGDQDLFVGARNFTAGYRGRLDFFLNDGDEDQAILRQVPGTSAEAASLGFADILQKYSMVNSSVNGIGPAIVDLNADGAWDLVLAVDSDTETGVLFYYEQVDGTWTLQTGSDNPFKKISFPNSDAVPSFTDLDQDGDLDIVTGVSDSQLIYVVNYGNEIYAKFKMVTGLSNPFFGVNVGTGVVAALDDYDVDGDQDLILGSADGTLQVYKNVRHLPSFEAVPDDSSPLDNVDTVFQSAPALYDLDLDGDMDIVSGSFDGTSSVGFLLYFENTGSATDPEFVQSSGSHLGEPFASFDGAVLSESGQLPRPAFVDINDDGLIDLVEGGQTGRLFLYLNNGTAGDPHFLNATGSAVTNPFADIDVGSNADPSFGDADGDGDFDLAVGSWKGTVRYYRNDGTATSPNFTLATRDPFGGVDWGRGASVSMGDIDEDGLLDVAIGDWNGELFYILNQGNESFPDWTGTAVELPDIGDQSAVLLADVDGDDDLDFLVGEEKGSLFFFANGRCFSSIPCNGNGGCVDEVLYPTCSCFLGFTDDQCNDCLDGFYGTSCELCPGGGTTELPTLTNVCSQQGICSDGFGDAGDGSCSCNAPFSGKDCSGGACPAGYERVLNATSGLYECDACAVGTYKASAGNNDSCLPCPVGTAMNSTGATVCDACEAGTFAESIGSVLCSKCSTGTFASSNGSTSCTFCPAGSFSDTTGSTACTSCPKGSFVGSSGASACEKCAKGTFTDSKGSTICDQCSTNDGFTTNSTGATACEACLPSYYWKASSGECKDCGSGTDCDKELVTLEDLPLESGYWRQSSTSVEVYECPLDGSCKGGSTSGNDGCKKGYRGSLCAVCADEYYLSPGTNSCEPCAGAAYAPMSIVVMVVVAALLLGLTVTIAKKVFGEDPEARPSASSSVADEPALPGLPLRTNGAAYQYENQNQMPKQMQNQPRSDDGNADARSNASRAKSEAEEAEEGKRIDAVVNKAGILGGTEMGFMSSLWSGSSGGGISLRFLESVRTKSKSLLVFSQILSSLNWTLELEFPDVFGELLSALSFVNVDVVQILPTDCIERTDYVDELFAMCIFPFCILGLIGLAYLAHVWWRRLPLSGTLELHSVYAGLALLLTFLVFPSVSTKVFRMFNCHELEDGESYLRADYSINCSSARYTMGTQFSIAMICVYPIGIPALYAALLWRIRERVNPDETDDEALRQRSAEIFDESDITLEMSMQLAKIERRDTDKALAPYSFLYGSYEPRVYWWEVFECLRRLLLTGLLVFMVPGTATQIVIALIISLASVKLYTQFGPFVEDEDDVVAEVAQWGIFFVMFCALLLRVEIAGSNSTSEQAIGAVLVVITLFAPVLAVCFLIKMLVAGPATDNGDDALPSTTAKPTDSGAKLPQNASRSQRVLHNQQQHDHHRAASWKMLQAGHDHDPTVRHAGSKSTDAANPLGTVVAFPASTNGSRQADLSGGDGSYYRDVPGSNGGHGHDVEDPKSPNMFEMVLSAGRGILLGADATTDNEDGERGPSAGGSAAPAATE